MKYGKERSIKPYAIAPPCLPSRRYFDVNVIVGSSSTGTPATEIRPVSSYLPQAFPGPLLTYSRELYLQVEVVV